MDNRIGVWRDSKIVYPTVKDNFRPDYQYIEFSSSVFQEYTTSSNKVYEAIRNTFLMLEYDKENIGTNNWNPLRNIVHPGENVVIKPNMVMHINKGGEGEECLYTHPSMVAPIIDYCILAMSDKGAFKGKIIVGDAPMQECDFGVLIEKSGYKKLIDFYHKKGFNIELKDFRNVKTVVQNGVHIKKKNEQNGILVRVDEKSNFSDVSKEKIERLRITNYDPHILQEHHNITIHEYKVAKELLEADVIINMPKPKTHRKAGVTISLKNMIGISANKEYLPHHTNGSKEEGGDAYLYKNNFYKISDYFLDRKNSFVQQEKYDLARMCSFFSRCFGILGNKIKKDYREGSWYGNDTIWRTIYDLNNIIFMADKTGKMSNQICRKMLIVADMVIAGEKDGPLMPSPKKCGVIAIGQNPALFDETVCSLMGFKLSLIPTIFHLREKERLFWFNEKEVGHIFSNCDEWNNKTAKEINKNISLQFVENPGWKVK